MFCRRAAVGALDVVEDLGKKGLGKKKRVAVLWQKWEKGKKFV